MSSEHPIRRGRANSIGSSTYTVNNDGTSSRTVTRVDKTTRASVDISYSSIKTALDAGNKKSIPVAKQLH